MEQKKKPKNKATIIQLIYDKGDTYIQWKKDSLFNILCWGRWVASSNEIRTFSHHIKNKLVYKKQKTKKQKQKQTKK